MKILVCVKQVPDPEQLVVEENADGLIELGDFRQYRMNRFDEYAVEEAILLKETLGGVRVDALTVGPERAGEVVARAVGMGADRGVHLLTAAGDDPQPAAVSSWVSQYASPKGYDLIFTGSMSEDGMNGQVGSMTAAFLDLPCATQVIDLHLVDCRSMVSVEREIEGGLREKLQLRLPAVLALQSGVNRPRYPSLSNLLRANRQKAEIIGVDVMQPPAATLDAVGTVLPRRRRSVTMLAGTPHEKAAQFLSILMQKAFIR